MDNVNGVELDPFNLPKYTMIIGRAGHGKTGVLVDTTSTLLKSDVSPSNVCIVTFQRSAAQEYTDRLMGEVVQERNAFPWAGTMHSIASKLVGFSRKNEMKNDDLREFVVEMYGSQSLDVLHQINQNQNNRYIERDRSRAIKFDKYKVLLGLDSIARNMKTDRFGDLEARGINTRYPIYSFQGFDVEGGQYVPTWKRGKSKHVTEREFTEFQEKYREWKSRYEYMDYTDIVEKCIQEEAAPSTTYMFVDEFQDFTPLQQELFSIWKENTKHTIVFGDDAQAINRFAGASPAMMSQEKPDRVISIRQSHRYGSDIYWNADKYLRCMNNLQDVETAPNNEIKSTVSQCEGDEWKKLFLAKYEEIHLENQKEYVRSKETGTLPQYGHIMVMAATSRWASQLKKEIHEMIPEAYVTENSENSYNEKDLLKAYNTIAYLEQGHVVLGQEIDMMKWCLKSSVFQKERINGHLEIVIKDICGYCELDNIRYNKEDVERDVLKIPWDGHTLIQSLKDVDRRPELVEHFPTVIPMDASMSIRPIIEISTIHRAKGRQAHTTFTFMSVPAPSVKFSYRPEVQDDICRTFYVGTTRASTNMIEVRKYLKNGRKIAPSPEELVSGL